MSLNDSLLDVTLELVDLDPEEVFFEPIQKSLDQCKSAKVVSRCALLRKSWVVTY